MKSLSTIYKSSQKRKIAVIAIVFATIVIAAATAIYINTYNFTIKSKAASVQDQFVYKNGIKLYIGADQFRFAGTNLYWLGLDENVGGVDYPTHFRIDDAFSSVQKMGGTVVRSHTLGISTGCDKCLEPSLNVFNDKAFESIDYSIKSAADHGVKLIIPLTDQWDYYHGGKHNFTEWRGLSQPGQARTNATDAFHHDPQVISDFKAYIAHLLNHTNQYTGIALKNDPTIMSWETGNELFTYGGSAGGTAAWSESWTQDIASYIKSLSPKSLAADGRVGNSEGSHILDQSLDNSAIDMMSDHHYPMKISDIKYDAKRVTQAGKIFFVGEYDWINKTGGDSLTSFLNEIENNSDITGDLYWMLLPRLSSDTQQYVQHSDGYALHYPGDDDNMKNRVIELTNHANKMSGTAAQVTPVGTTPVLSPTSTPTPVPEVPTPTPTSIPIVTNTTVPTQLGGNASVPTVIPELGSTSIPNPIATPTPTLAMSNPTATPTSIGGSGTSVTSTSVSPTSDVIMNVIDFSLGNNQNVNVLKPTFKGKDTNVRKIIIHSSPQTYLVSPDSNGNWQVIASDNLDNGTHTASTYDVSGTLIQTINFTVDNTSLPNTGIFDNTLFVTIAAVGLISASTILITRKKRILN